MAISMVVVGGKSEGGRGGEASGFEAEGGGRHHR
jgi:hypothetical protein